MRLFSRNTNKRMPMKHNFTSLLSSIPGPSQETILALQLLARVYNPANTDLKEPIHP